MHLYITLLNTGCVRALSSQQLANLRKDAFAFEVDSTNEDERNGRHEEIRTLDLYPVEGTNGSTTIYMRRETTKYPQRRV